MITREARERSGGAASRFRSRPRSEMLGRCVSPRPPEPCAQARILLVAPPDYHRELAAELARCTKIVRVSVQLRPARPHSFAVFAREFQVISPLPVPGPPHPEPPRSAGSPHPPGCRGSPRTSSAAPQRSCPHPWQPPPERRQHSTTRSAGTLSTRSPGSAIVGQRCGQPGLPPHSLTRGVCGVRPPERSLGGAFHIRRALAFRGGAGACGGGRCARSR